MKAKSHFILFVVIVLSLLAILLAYTFWDNKWLILLSELFLVLLILYAYRVQKSIFQPIKLMREGLDALQDEDFNVKFNETSSTDINQLVKVYNGMIDKIRNERVYQQEQHFFLDLLIGAMPIGVIILDFDGKVSEFNPKTQELFSISKKDIGKEIAEIDHEIGLLLSELAVGQSNVFKIESVHYYRCTANRFMYKGFPRVFILIEELSNELLRVEKRAYGKVIRMMAHEVNNSNGAINSILNSLLSFEKIEQDTLKEYLPIVIERNEGLTQFMKNFAEVIRLPEPVKKEVDVHAVLLQSSQLIQSQFAHLPITFQNDFAGEAFIIHADKSQLEQAFINILKNSVEAISGAGEILLVTDKKERKIEIIDNGEGIKEDINTELFTPFYSTKATGQGIGLTLVKEILINHDYRFTLKSEKGKTYFTILGI